MNYTPFAGLTDEELLREVRNKKDSTTLEVELMLRLEHMLDELEGAHGNTGSESKGQGTLDS